MNDSSLLHDTVRTLMETPAVRTALAFLEHDAAHVVEELKAMAVIHGAPFREHCQRSPMYKARLAASGAADCRIDAEGNVTGHVYGTAQTARPAVLVEAHLDTVFPEETPLAVTERDGVLFCPGIGDDTAALACNLSVLRAIRHAGLIPVGQLIFGGTVGEEGEGNSRGIRHLLTQTLPYVDAVLSLECFNDKLCLEAIGICRREYLFRAQGGHSWFRFGTPNPCHAMGRAIAGIASLQVPQTPRTTFNVGLVESGTSINTIPQSASMKIDMRSVEMTALQQLADRVQACVEQAVSEENARWNSSERVTFEIRDIGAKPAGSLPETAMLARLAAEVTEQLGGEVCLTAPASTNQNIPLSMGIPALVMGSGGICRNVHRLDESYSPQGAPRGAQRVLLMLLALAGLDGVTTPLADLCPPCRQNGQTDLPCPQD